MRIALVSQAYPPETGGGGIATQTYMKAHGLAGLGHDVLVISHSIDTQRHEYSDGNVSVVRIPAADGRMPVNSPAVRWLTYSAEVAAEIARSHRNSPIDLIDFPEYGAEGFTYLLNRTEWDRIPVAIHLHGPLVMLAETIGWPEPGSEFERVGIFMEGTSLRLADAIFSSSRCSAEWMKRGYNRECDGVEVIHTGIDTQHFSPRDIPKEERPTIVFVGKIVANKGVDILVEAVCRLVVDIPDLQLRLIGPGDRDLSEKLRMRANATGRPDILDIVGFVAHEDLPEHLSRAHLFAAPSLYEGGPGFVYLEAMACGLPVIACSGSGAAEVVIPEVNGLLVEPGDVDGLVEALLRLLSTTSYRETMGVSAREYAVDTADSRKCLARMERFYEKVIATTVTSSSGVQLHG